MNETPYIHWASSGWRGRIRADVPIAPADVLAVVGSEAGRRSRHARTQRVELDGRVVYVKAYPTPDGQRAWRAFRLGEALRRSGLGAPEVLLVGRRGGAGVLVTQDVGGRSLVEAVAEAGAAGQPNAAKWGLLRALGAEIGRLHRLGFVHGDLVPSNVQAGPRGFVFLDNDRTRRSRVLVWWHGRRNLVQLGRFVVPGISVSDPRRTRVARWLIQATMARRCRIDAIPSATAFAVGFRELMRSGGPFDRPDEARR
jgi:hypothetical protein